MTSKTKSQIAADDLSALMRARNVLLWIVTREESRVEGYIMQAAQSANYITRTWDVAQGVADMNGKPDSYIGSPDPGETLQAIKTRATDGNERGVWIMRDLPVWLSGITGATVNRQLRNIARTISPRDRAQCIIVISPSGDIPAELAGHATVINWPLPDRSEIAAILDSAIDVLPDTIKATAAPNGTRDAAIDAAVGLSGDEALACYGKSLVLHKRIDPVAVAQEKKTIVARERVLEYFEPLPGGLSSVGGLDCLKTWLLSRVKAYSPQARAYGLPAPKGVFLVGISGCGKSLSAKAIATALGGIPLLRLDFGALKSKFVGESEGNLRKAFSVIESLGRCVVWIDEVEKAMQGATSGSADGGVSADALGTFLTWMQERRGDAFVVATANDVTGLPPEFLRKGRFDEIFWIDLPNARERVEVLCAALKVHGRSMEGIDGQKIAAACDGFTGSEIAAIVPDALFLAFDDNARPVSTQDLLTAASAVVPLSRTAKEKIDLMRQWAVGRARSATSPLADTRSNLRVLDIA